MDLNGSDDASLVTLARTGDRQAFACLFGRHQALMRRICQRALGTSDGLEDVAQEAALQAMLSLNELRDPRQFGSWLIGIGLNVARRSRRDHARMAWSWDALVGGRMVLEPIDPEPWPADQVELAELSRSIRAAVAELPAGQRAAVLLVYLSGLTYRETAATLGVEVGAVKTRLHKGRRRLQQRLKHVWLEDLSMSARSTPVEQHLVEMRVADVRRRSAEGDRPARSVVVLEEVGGSRRLPIWTGNWEGDQIAMQLEKLQVPRPLTHVLVASLLDAGGLRVREVRINRLLDETFYAQVVVDGAGSGAPRMVDARPSDAIALALQTSSPIYVGADVLETVEAARAAKGQTLALEGIGAAEIVRQIVDEWPYGPKPGTAPA